MSPRTVLPAVVLLASSLLLAGCGGDDEPPKRGSTPAATSSSATPTPRAQEGTTQAAGPVLGEVAEALRSAGRVTVSASLAGGPARELTVETTQVADALDAVAVEQVVHVGPEQVDGVATEHYRVALDPKAALAGITLPAQVQAMLPDSLDADVWLDDRSRPVKVRAEPGVELMLSYDVSAP
ncbi:hypothetical protein [Nocardioides daeguensis]|uniref:LppX_LprAFG lipoprotein n=1 Tax=Nocardioides daeguensis TaxID=908359 RepID=A0ABP6WI55_9ACTN|nr:hypothetical protein [Nocardioides daeguensis]MBV6729064.1 hypothetical protein [Nocardioides daeguensis]MCR1774932.1 hypothetical protein [Nocardioides daeguensis]